MSIRLRFLATSGDLLRETAAEPGERLLDVAQALGLPLEGTCEGSMACSTCHVILTKEDFRHLPAPSAHEEDMLDFTPHVAATSRLSCQLLLPADLDSMDVILPPAHADMSRV